MKLVKNISKRTIGKGEFITLNQVEFIKDCDNCPAINLSKSYNKLPDCCVRCLKRIK